MSPDPFLISWRGYQLRVRHDDPGIGTYTQVGQQLRAAVEFATDLAGLRFAVETMVGDRCRVRVADDGRAVEMWRRG